MRHIKMVSAPYGVAVTVYRSLAMAVTLVVTGILLLINLNGESYSWLPFSGKNLRTRLAWDQYLRFSEDGTFQISIFEDLHYGEAEDREWGPLQDTRSEKVMNGILSIESPQLVVLNGDLITGEDTFPQNSSLYLDHIVRPMVQRGLPWASTYGNHDSDVNLSSRATFEREKKYPNSLTQNMIGSRSSGLTNYFLPVYGSKKGMLEHPSLLLWFFDSQSGNYFQERDNEGNKIPRPSWVHEDVVTWFRDTNARLTDFGRIKIPSLAFVHVPINAMLAFQNGGVDGHREPGTNDDVPVSQQGLRDGEDKNGSPIVYYNGGDIPFMAALIETPGMMAVFSGHDHGNDWCFKWDTKLPGMNLTGNGLDVCFGRHTGYGGYGLWTRGSRQILLDEKTLGSATETWIRLEDGEVSGRVMLNSTYGRDEYPTVKD